ncbi:MAG: PAS domain S-box protein [Proteobacteria bacterium]|nr:PAS domain S-box protein [Pseudomonadota bacterium]
MKDGEKTKKQLIDEVKILRWTIESSKNGETERKRLEEMLRESEEKMCMFFNANPQSIFLADAEGTIIAANESCAVQLGRGRDECAGLSLYGLFPPGVAEKRRGEIEEAVFTRRQVHFEDICNERYYDNYIFPVLDDPGLVSKVVMFSSDISERKHLEKLLEQAEWKYRHTYEIVTEGIFQTAPDGHLLSVNNALARIYGYASPEDFMHSVADITHLHYVNSACRSEFIRLLKKDGIVYDFEAQMYRKDKSTVWVSINVRTVRDKRKKILYYEGAVEDITKRKRLEAQLVHSQKTETIGKLSSGIAHNFNNLLTVVTGNFELLIRTFQLHDTENREIKAIHDAIGQGLKLCEELLSLSRRQLIRPVETNIGSVITKMEGMLKHLLGEDIAYDLSIDPDIRTVKADPSLIEQIILILAVNARDAMPEGGRLRISAKNTFHDEGQRPINPDTATGERVALTISDTGTGIAPDILEHIFEPFFTVKPDGTGLGLSIVHSIVKQSGGLITVDSEEGKGTAFRIYFPVLQAEEKAEEETSLRPADLTALKKATVLVVEDESGILYWVTDVLEGLGYTVLPAFNAEDAISIFNDHEGAIDLLITDLVLPGKSGQELAETIKVKHPGMKVIFMSGYGEDRIHGADILKNKTPFLAKPFTPLLLLMKVQETIRIVNSEGKEG